MKKAPCLLNAAMVLVLILGIAGCASTQEDESPPEIPEAQTETTAESPAASIEAPAARGEDPAAGVESRPPARVDIAETQPSAYPETTVSPERAYPSTWGFSSNEPASSFVVPENVTLDELRDEAGRMRTEAIQGNLDRLMPTEWRATEEAFNRGTLAYTESRQGFTEAVEGYINMGLQSALASAPPTAAAGTTILPAAYRVGEWSNTRDCLWNISANPLVYNDPLQWRVLYDANRNVLPNPDNPDLIMPGTILLIPSIRGERREGTYNPLTGQIEVGVLDLDYFRSEYMSINR